MLTTTTEQQLLKEISSGSASAFKRLFLEYYSPLCEFASQFIVDHEAEDLVQDLMISLWERREFLDITTSIRSYLFTATKNRCLNAIKKNQHIRQKQTLFYQNLREEFEDPNFYLANELNQQITQALERLPAGYKEVFTSSRLDQKNNQQIAQSFGLSVKTIEYRITRSLKLLRLELAEYLM